jgi:hypothetical protein
MFSTHGNEVGKKATSRGQLHGAKHNNTSDHEREVNFNDQQAAQRVIWVQEKKTRNLQQKQPKTLFD